MAAMADAWVAILDQRRVGGVHSSQIHAAIAAWRDVFPAVRVRESVMSTLSGPPPGYRVMRDSEWKVLGQLELECGLSS